ncbi:transglycosylase SLT domain-containing protein [Saccharopolyspora sp. NPDC002376]
MAFDAGAIESTLTLDRTPFTRGLQQARREAEKFRRDPISTRLDVDTRRATTAITGWRRSQEDRALGLGLNVDTAHATADMTAWRAEQSAKTIKQRVDVDHSMLDGLQAKLGVVNQSLGGFASGLAGASVKALALSGILYGLGASLPVLGALGEATVSLSQGLLLLPGGLAVAGAGLGTLLPAVTGVGDAFGAMAAAQDAAGESAEKQKAAQEDLDQALKNLAPSAQEFVRQTAALRDEFHALRLIDQQHLFAGLGQEVKTLGAIYVPVLKTGLSQVADAFNGAIKQVGAFAADSRTVADLGALFGSTATIVDNLGRALRPILAGLRDIGTVGAEYLARVTGGAQGAAESFAAWAAEARESGRLMTMFNDFGGVLKDLGAIVVNVGSIIGSVFSAMSATGAGVIGSFRQATEETARWLKTAEGSQQLINLFLTLKAVADQLRPAFVAVFSALGDALQVLLPVLPGVAANFANIVQAVTPLVQPLATLAAAVIPPLVAAVSALGPALPYVAAGFLAVTAAMRGLSIMTSISATFGKVSDGLGKIRDGFNTAKDSSASFTSRISGAATVLGAGVFGAAITAATIALGFLISSQQEAAERAQRHKDMVTNLAQALRESNGAIDENVRKTVAQQLQTDASYETYRRAGVSLRELTDIALGNAGAYDAVSARLAYLSENGYKMVNTGHGMSKMFTAQGTAAGEARTNLDMLRTTYGDAVQKNQDLIAAVSGATVTMSPLQQAFQTLASNTATAEQRTRAFNDSLDLLIGKNLGAAQSALSFQGTINGLTQSVTANGLSLDANTAAGMANRQAILNSLQAALNHAQAVQQQTGDVDKARDALRQNEQALYDNAVKVFGNRDAVDQLLRSVGGLPGQYDDAARNAEGMANRTNDALQGIKDKEIKVTATTKWLDTYMGLIREPQVKQTNPDSGIPLPLSRATGGPVYGPGTSTSDSIPAMLSNGEYVINAAATARHRPLIEAINANRLAEGGQPIPVKHLAKGGPAGRDVSLGYQPFRGDFGPPANTWIDRVTRDFGDQVSQGLVMLMGNKMFAGEAPAPPGGGGGGGGGANRWSGVIMQALAMLGQPASWLPTVLRRMNQESGGNPTVVNRWDSNWQRGTPSVGLMQVIGPTYRAYAGPFANTGPFQYGTSTNPLANTYAGLNYAIHRYGSLAALNRPGGYDNGGPLMPGYTLTYNGTGHPENVRTAAQEDELVTRLDRIETALADRPPVTVNQSFTGSQWSAEEAAAAGARHMTAALKELA